MAYQRDRYYYQSYREGDHIRTKYLGAGDLGSTIADVYNAQSAQRKAEREELKAERQAEKEHERDLDSIGSLIKAITRATLITNGYHTHKGTWRRSRNGRSRND